MQRHHIHLIDDDEFLFLAGTTSPLISEQTCDAAGLSSTVVEETFNGLRRHANGHPVDLVQISDWGTLTSAPMAFHVRNSVSRAQQVDEDPCELDPRIARKAIMGTFPEVLAYSRALEPLGAAGVAFQVFLSVGPIAALSFGAVARLSEMNYASDLAAPLFKTPASPASAHACLEALGAITFHVKQPRLRNLLPRQARHVADLEPALSALFAGS